MKALILGVFAVALACTVAVAAATVGSRISDGRSIYAVTAAIIDGHGVAIPAPLGVPAHRNNQPPGPFYSKYGIGQSLLAIPFYVGGRIIGHMLSVHMSDVATQLAGALFNACVLAVLAAMLTALALRLGFSRGWAAVLGLCVVLSTPLWPAAQTFFSEPVIALCLVVAVWAVMGPKAANQPLVAGVALAVATSVRLDSLIYYPILILALIFPQSPSGESDGLLRRLAVFAIPLILVGAGIATYDMVRFGSPFQTGYGLELGGESRDFTFERTVTLFAVGLWNQLFSPGKGVVWYAPLLLLLPWGIRRHSDRTVWILSGLCATCWVAHANLLIRWLGGWAWGPRFLLPILPLAMLLAAGVVIPKLGQSRQVVVRLATVFLIGGIVIQLPALAVDYHQYLYQLRDRYGSPYIAEDHYIPDPLLSPIIGQWQVALDPHTWTVPSNWGHWSPALVAADRQPQTTAARRMWWQVLAGEGIAPPILGALLALLALLASSGGILLWRLVRHNQFTVWSPDGDTFPRPVVGR